MAIAVDIQPDAEKLAQRVATWLTDHAESVTGTFTLALSGGSTPKRLYQVLATAPFRDRFPWARTHLFWGDERFVPRDHPDSNYRMVHEAMLSHVPIPATNIHGVPVDGAPEDAARAYQRTLQEFYGATAFDAGRPLFNVTLLGLGEDGHTASLFPGTETLKETKAWVAAVIGARSEARLTLTYPALASSNVVAFLVAGEGKREVLRRLRAGDTSMPAARVSPTGEVRVFADAAAVRDGNG
jgi:6-phosphogluconolactonase